jgi:FtsP/CotA-like multicopper oxidase with cupredoxin domain
MMPAAHNPPCAKNARLPDTLWLGLKTHSNRTYKTNRPQLIDLNTGPMPKAQRVIRVGAATTSKPTAIMEQPMPSPAAPVSRRRVLAGAAASVTAIALPLPIRAQTPDPAGFRLLRASAGGLARLRGATVSPTPVWGYDGSVPGPLLRVRQGEELKIRLVNDLPQPTVVHWHGLRIVNAMDGVPHLTQKPIEPGARFDYRFVAPDAGTFWYHSHLHSSEQQERGLYGVLIVDEAEPPKVDRDIALVFDDWRLSDDGSIHAASFGSLFDAAHAGRLGQYLTLNSEDKLDVKVQSNERIRLRLINTANARIATLRFDRHRPQVVALDGQPVPPPYPAGNGAVTLGPGNRADLILDTTLAPGATASILVDDLRGGEIEIGRVVYDGGEAKRKQPLTEQVSLPANPLPERFELQQALHVDVPLDGGAMAMMMGGRGGGMGGMMGGMMGGGGFRGQGIEPRARIWALAGISATGHDGPPMFTVERGRTVVMSYANRTVFTHAMHIHGHHFRLRESGGEAFRPFWLDTVLVGVRQTEQIAFVADNPGKWMMHCHMLEHLQTGMGAWFHVV